MARRAVESLGEFDDQAFGSADVAEEEGVLEVDVEALLAELRLPGPAEARPVDLRLAPLRSRLDRRAEVRGGGGGRP